jgi:hypothetical protein
MRVRVQVVKAAAKSLICKVLSPAGVRITSPNGRHVSAEVLIPRAAIEPVGSEITPAADLGAMGWVRVAPWATEGKAEWAVVATALKAEADRAARLAQIAQEAPPPPLPPLPEPTPSQAAAVAAIVEHFRSAPAGTTVEASLAGPAGSGKTTVTRLLLEALQPYRGAVICCAPTAKAAGRLAESVGSARTIHSAFYKIGELTEQEDTGELLFDESKSRDPFENAEEGRPLLVVDEASMVDAEIGELIRTNLQPGTWILWVGDSAQLPPVGLGRAVDLEQPTAALTEVLRQAAGNPIIQLATAIRQGGLIREVPLPDGCPVRVVQRARYAELAEAIRDERAAGADVAVVVPTHRMRHEVNRAVRAALGHREVLQAGDRLLVRRNAHGQGLTNGKVITVQRVVMHESLPDALVTAAVQTGAPREVLGEVLDDLLDELGGYNGRVAEVYWSASKPPLLVPVELLEADAKGWYEWAKPLKQYVKGAEPTPPTRAVEYDDEWKRYWVAKGALMHVQAILHGLVPVNYGEAITCHAAQGSQWTRVVVALDAGFAGRRTAADPEERLFYRQWFYTAVTRASKELDIYAIP